MRKLVFDIETDNVDYHKITTIHTIAIYDLEEKKMYSFDRGEVYKGIEMLDDNLVIGHNIVKYDIPVIQKFYPTFRPKQVVDTMILSTLAFSDIGANDKDVSRVPSKLKGTHSLKAWGYRLGILKGDFAEKDAWDEWSKEMKEYCIQDVRVTVKLYNFLKTMHYSKEAIVLEHQVAKIIGRQERYGFYFDIEKAYQLENRLRTEMEELERKLQEIFPPKKKIVGYYTRPNKKRRIKPGDPKIVIEEFNPGSRQQIIQRLEEKYGDLNLPSTEKGNKQLDDTILASLPYPEAELLAKYMLLKKRLGMLSDGKVAWLKSYNPTTHRIHGSVLTNGAVTARMRHQHPNMAQIPAEKEYRELFRAAPGKVLVGVDAKALEFRCFAHRVNDPDYTKVILEGDIHTTNQQLAGLATRSDAKTFIYAFLYGGGDTKLGSIVNPEASPEQQKKLGAKLRKKFLQAIPGLEKLTNGIKKQAKKHGYIVGLDGRHLKVRSLHKALNLLLQSDGAIVMKKGLTILDRDLRAEGLIPGEDYEFVGNIHDEWQIETKPELAEKVAEIAKKAIYKAGVYFGFNCPLAGDAKIGETWAETH